LSHGGDLLTEKKDELSQELIFFDGVCHLCNGFVNFALQNETLESKLVFTPLQGETAKKYLAPEDRESLESVLFYENGQVWRKSTAVLKILKRLRSPWPWIGTIGQWIPTPIRDRLYSLVANHRYRFFGRSEACRLPLPHEREKLWP
jgi:predicted DCC family thiol-disulfide oxidoreductase YuxK